MMRAASLFITQFQIITLRQRTRTRAHHHPHPHPYPFDCYQGPHGDAGLNMGRGVFQPFRAVPFI